MGKYIISVIGESTVSPDSQKYILAEKLGEKLIDNNFRIQHGGRGGIMEAISKGAKSSKNYQEGMLIGILPDFSRKLKNKYTDIVIPTGLDIMRNAIVVNADAVIAIGGGAGTLSEMAMAWSMKRLLIAYDIDGWSGKLAGTKIDHRKRTSDPEDKVYKVSNEQEVLQILNKKLDFYTTSHSGI